MPQQLATLGDWLDWETQSDQMALNILQRMLSIQMEPLFHVFAPKSNSYFHFSLAKRGIYLVMSARLEQEATVNCYGVKALWLLLWHSSGNLCKNAALKNFAPARNVD